MGSNSIANNTVSRSDICGTEYRFRPFTWYKASPIEKFASLGKGIKGIKGKGIRGKGLGKEFKGNWRRCRDRVTQEKALRIQG